MNRMLWLLKRQIRYHFNKRKGVPFCPHCGSPYTSDMHNNKAMLRWCSECGLFYDTNKVNKK